MKKIILFILTTALTIQFSWAEEQRQKGEKQMPHVTGIGGVFFKSKDAKALTAWYEKNLGITLQPWGGAVFRWSEDKAPEKGATAWHIDDINTDKYSPSQAPFMINYRVDDLTGLIANLKKAGVEIVKEPESTDHGKFASILDPDGNKVELWEP